MTIRANSDPQIQRKEPSVMCLCLSLRVSLFVSRCRFSIDVNKMTRAPLMVFISREEEATSQPFLLLLVNGSLCHNIVLRSIVRQARCGRRRRRSEHSLTDHDESNLRRRMDRSCFHPRALPEILVRDLEQSSARKRERE